jgi:ParB-like chromosome segregation protein Spo0J
MSFAKPSELHELALAEIGEHYRRYRLCTPDAERVMRASLERYGQISPVVVCTRDGQAELIDGFKRLSAARVLESCGSLVARFVDADDRAAKVAMYCLNRVAGRTRELEEARIVQALVREDGLTQPDVAKLLGRHKSWVCRRLALIERLCPQAEQDLQLGLLLPTAAREVSRLPHGNQSTLLEVIRRESLTSSEVARVVDLMLTSADGSQREFVLKQPREAIRRGEDVLVTARDPRLSPVGNRLCRKLSLLLELSGEVENWLRHRGRANLTAADQQVIAPQVRRLPPAGSALTEAAQDFLLEPTIA